MDHNNHTNKEDTQFSIQKDKQENPYKFVSTLILFAITTLILRFVAAKVLRHNLSLRNYFKHDLQSILCHNHSDKIDDQRFVPLIIQTLDIN